MTDDGRDRDDRPTADDVEERDSVEPAQGTDVTAGKGRRDEVGHTGIYPPGVDVPDDTEVITPGELGRRKE